MTFLRPALLPLGIVLTIFVGFAFWRHARRRRHLADFLGGARAARSLSRSDLSRPHVERVVLVGLATLAVAAAAAEPRLRVTPPREPSRSIVLAIDVSASMQASDVSPTRLAQAVEIAGELLDAFENDRVGLLVFAGNAYPLARPTLEHDVLRYLLAGVTPTMATAHDPGSLPSAAIRGAEGLWRTAAEPGEERALILLSDGEAGEVDENVLAAAREAADRGVRVHAIGVGTDAGGGMVLARAAYQLGGPVLDLETGVPATSVLNAPLLERIVEAGRGSYVHANDDPVAAIEASLVLRRASLPWWARYDYAAVLVMIGLGGLLMDSLLDVRLPGWRPAMGWKRTP